jgi:glycosyltransferase involved in cell wall biosynthesis
MKPVKTRSNHISLVIPAYNEESRIETVLVNYCEYFPNEEIIVVCNGCDDDTPNIVEGLGSKYPQIKILNFRQKLGKGGSIIEGFKVAEGDKIGFIDCDQSVEPEDVEKIFCALSHADGVIASRRLKDSQILAKQPLRRRIASKTFNLLVRMIFSLRFKDTQCGAKVFRREALKSVLPELRTGGFEFDVELVWRLKGKGYKVVEFPIRWKHSEGSTFSLSNAPGMFLSLLKVRFWS